MLDLTLHNYIKHQIKQFGGAIPFADFMQSALYAPNIGYYTSKCEKFGKNGDFITAPMLGNLFAKCIKNKCLNILKNTQQINILELGAGNGQLAEQLLNCFNSTHCNSVHDVRLNNYFILEPSYELRTRQQQLLLNHKHYTNNIFWLDQLPEKFNGIILANEVLDALPVSLFTIKHQLVFEKLVTIKHNKLVFTEQLANETLKQAVLKLPLDLNNSYTSEVCLLMPEFIKSLANSLDTGAILLFDYGFLEHEYYHPARNSGTLMCHYKHQAHTDPLFLPGLQDITAHVDFSLIIQLALKYNLEIADFSSMANFLMQNNLSAELNQLNIIDLKQQLKLNQEITTLMSPQEMGEIFKSIALIKK